MYFLIHPLVSINDERMDVHCLKSGCIGLHIPSDLKISLGPQDVPGASPSVVGDDLLQAHILMFMACPNMAIEWQDD